MDILGLLLGTELGLYPEEDESNIIDVECREIPIDSEEGGMLCDT